MKDKVYVRKERDNVTYSLSVQFDNGGEEYIRKDAIIELIKKSTKQDIDLIPAWKVIDLINSL